MKLIDITDLTDTELAALLDGESAFTDVTDMTPAEFAAFMEEGIAKAAPTGGDIRNGVRTRYLDGHLLTDENAGNPDAF